MDWTFLVCIHLSIHLSIHSLFFLAYYHIGVYCVNKNKTILNTIEERTLYSYTTKQPCSVSQSIYINETIVKWFGLWCPRFLWVLVRELFLLSFFPDDCPSQKSSSASFSVSIMSCLWDKWCKNASSFC